jgi:hypothetical protein
MTNYHPINALPAILQDARRRQAEREQQEQQQAVMKFHAWRQRELDHLESEWRDWLGDDAYAMLEAAPVYQSNDPTAVEPKPIDYHGERWLRVLVNGAVIKCAEYGPRSGERRFTLRRMPDGAWVTLNIAYGEQPEVLRDRLLDLIAQAYESPMSTPVADE